MLKKIAREDNFLSLTGNLVIAILGIGGFALLARSLSLNVFGEWVLFVTGGSFVEMFRFGITNTGLIRFLSGADEDSRTKLIGSNALIGLGATVLIAIILVFCYTFFNDAISNSGYNLFFKWYPILAFLNLPWNNALVVLQADRRYDKILIIKSINSGLFFLVILVHFLFIDMELNQLVIALIIINAISSFMDAKLFKFSGNKNLPSLSKFVGIISENIDVVKSSCSSEKKSKLFLESTIQSALFGVSPKADLSLTYLSNLPNDVSTSPKYQVYTAFAHLLRGNQESAISLLKTLCDSNPNSSDTWIETARSLSDGTEFGGSRKALFLEQLEKLYEHWQKDADAFLIEGAWLHSNEKQILNFQIGVDKKKEKVVLHFQQNEKPFFSYQVSPNGFWYTYINKIQEIKTTPILIPAFKGIFKSLIGFLSNEAKAILEFAKVFILIPNQATA